MFLKSSGSRNHAWWLGLGILLTGILIGSLADPIAWMRLHSIPEGTTAKIESVELAPHLQKRRSEPDASNNGLETLYLNIPDEQAHIIQRSRDRAIERGLIIQEDTDTVPASLQHNNREYPVEIRIKGDLIDHVKSDKWSFRIGISGGRLFGMRTFSIQAPSIRGFLWEWLILQTARREGLLAPRSMFVNLVLNNNPCGVYYLEEHFSKELLESQGRREGPILRFDESTYWFNFLQNHIGALGPAAKLSELLHLASEGASIRAYGERHLTSIESLNRSFISALEKVQELQNLMIMENNRLDRLVRLQAVNDLKGKTMDSLMDVKKWAKAHALASLFQIWHGLIWLNVRFYFNPVTDRLEPVLFDNMCHAASTQDLVILRPNALVKELGKSTTYYTRFFRYLSAFSEESFLDGLFQELEPEMRKIQAALHSEAPLDANFRIDALKQRLRSCQIFLKKNLNPIDPVNFACFFQKNDLAELPVDGILEVKAWATTKIATVMEGFRFSNGHFVLASSCLAGPPSHSAVLDHNNVLLPPNGQPLLFRFPANPRLANLSNIQEIKSTIRKGYKQQEGLRLDDVTAVFRTVSSRTSSEEVLYFRPYETAWRQEDGRPPFPSLDEALNRHPFLMYNIEKDRLEVRPGTWEVKGDLLVPAGYALHASPGVTLCFAQGSVLVTDSPLIFLGSNEAPIVLKPKEGHPCWSGILVLNAEERSTWSHVRVKNTTDLKRAGWITTGGITFYYSPVSLHDCLIDGTQAEDGINIFGTDCLLEKVTFFRCVSDCFDGDFITGTVKNCVFREGGADGLDFCGSDVTVAECRFIELGDKAISVGEKTHCRVSGGMVDRAAIGLASKDLSHVEVQKINIRSVKHFAIAVYMKKPEYGPSSVRACELQIEENVLRPYLVQTGCTLTVEGKEIDTESFDVGRLYDEKILGN